MQRGRKRIYQVIFHTNTRMGKLFDILLLIMILFSVLAVILESVKPIRIRYPDTFVTMEWIFTMIFTLEYLLRIYSHPKPLRYMVSFLGIIDLLAILPTYLGLFFDQATFLLTIRAFRLLRMFRILKLTRYVIEANYLMKALKSSLYKITIFFGVVLALVLLLGTLMYMVEGQQSGFTSIPQSIYWAIVTITTVGYGDIAPVTTLGKLIAAVAMLTGYSIIAVPTGIISVEIGRVFRDKPEPGTKQCKKCTHDEPDPGARYCKFCGEKLE